MTTRKYELTIERRVQDTYVVEATSRTDASMKVAELILGGVPPDTSVEVERKTKGAPVVLDEIFPATD